MATKTKKKVAKKKVAKKKVAKKKVAKKMSTNVIATENDISNNLIKEYEICINNWRFFVGLRFTVLAFFLSLNSGLLFLLLKPIGEKETPHMLLPLLPLLGLTSIIAACMIENRNRQMYFACMQRAKMIEIKLNYESNAAIRVERKTKQPSEIDVQEDAKNNCIANLLDNRCPISKSSSQTLGIRLMYGTLSIIWVVLLIQSSLPAVGYAWTCYCQFMSEFMPPFF